MLQKQPNTPYSPWSNAFGFMKLIRSLSDIVAISWGIDVCGVFEGALVVEMGSVVCTCISFCRFCDETFCRSPSCVALLLLVFVLCIESTIFSLEDVRKHRISRDLVGIKTKKPTFAMGFPQWIKTLIFLTPINFYPKFTNKTKLFFIKTRNFRNS